MEQPDDEDVRGVHMLISKVSNTADLYVRKGVGPDELIRILATYVPETARLESAGIELGGELSLRFALG
jgi:hypothetical protein